LAYALFGTTGASYGENKKPAFDLIEEANKSANSITIAKNDGILDCVQKFSRPIQEVLLVGRQNGAIEFYPCHIEEPWPGCTIGHIFFFGYYTDLPARGQQPWTVDLRFWHQNGILCDPYIDFEANKMGFPHFIRGSVAIGDLLFNSKFGLMLHTPPDERFSAFRKSFPTDDWGSITLPQSAEIAMDYIRACDSDLGRKLDPICKTIGGHIHVAQITPKGFQWIIPPAA
jgi:hypothetical protein